MRLQRMWLVPVTCLLGSGCDIPTEGPIIEQRWVLPLEEVGLDQSQLLPPDVTIAGSLYDVTVAPVVATESLGNVCPPCAALDGLMVPTPAYQGSIVSIDNLPTDVVSADVVSGSVDITITNGFTFDPIAGGGSLTITVAGASGGPVLGTLFLAGPTVALPPFSPPTMHTLLLTDGTVTGAIETTVVIDHTGGQDVPWGASEVIRVDGDVTSLLLDQVTVAVDGLSASFSEEQLDVANLDEGLIDEIQSGSVLLDITNPFGVTWTGSIAFGAIIKDVDIPADPTSSRAITFTGIELQSILRQDNATFSGTGTLGGGPAVVTPTAEIIIDPTIDLITEIGG